jgi:hypothetical protein
MGFDQYHEPPEELPQSTRTFARLCASLTEEAEAIGWYEQRIAVEKDQIAQGVLFQSGDIVAHGEEAEEEATEGGGEDGGSSGDGTSSLGIGSLKGALA